MEATCTDLAVVKDIPGYKTIMKTLLKHQIQQLVEQLSETTGEQSVLLMASVSDRTFSHLGSEFGKNFLDRHGEVKAQFFAFLKSQHTKKPKQPFASGPSKSVGMKKRKAVKTAPSSKGSGAHTDIYIKEDDRVQEQLEGTATTVMEPSLEVTTINNAEPTHVDNHLETNTAAMERSAKLDNYVGHAEEPRNTTQDLSEDAVRTVTDSAEDTTENNKETWPLSGSVPIVGTPKLETDVLFQNQRVISNELSAPLEMDTVIVKKEAGLDAEEGSDTDEGAILNNDDSDWEPSIKKQRKSSVSDSGSSLTVSADQAQTLEMHTEDGEASYACCYCDQLFSCLGDVTSHVKIHTEKKLYRCNTCGKLFKRQNDFNEHKKIHFEEKLYSCGTCGQSFKHYEGLIRHEKIHSGEKPYSCEICGKSFIRQDGYQRHMQTHAGKKTHICETCGKSFTLNEYLRKHQKIHAGLKPYTCQTCGKSFIRARYLSKHQATHAEERNFNCEICGKLFPSIEYLRRHLKIHSGYKPHSCQTCGKSFVESGDLLKHQATHAGEKAFNCEMCGKLFSSMDYLRKHRKRHFRDEPHTLNFSGKG